MSTVEKEPCTHFRKTEVWINENEGVYGYEPGHWHYISESTCVDISTGRFKCTQCGEVMYYTGLWKAFYENGIPCPGSDTVDFTPVPEPEVSRAMKALVDHVNKGVDTLIGIHNFMDAATPFPHSSR